MGKSKELAELGSAVVQTGGTTAFKDDTLAIVSVQSGNAHLSSYAYASGFTYDLSTASQAHTVGTASSAPTILKTGNVERMRIDASGRVTMPYQPAFRAYLSTEWTTISAYVNSGWTEQYDRNNNFNQGTFTAPVEGVYNFTVAWDALSTQSRLCLDRNGSFTGGFRYEPTGLTTDAWETHSYSADVFLNTNDYVKLYLEGGGGTNPIHMGGNQWGFFAGHLVG